MKDGKFLNIIDISHLIININYRSLLIRYPYELTIRGVLKYQIFPSFISSKVFSARVCKIVEIDPSTGLIKEVPLPEQSICDES